MGQTIFILILICYITDGKQFIINKMGSCSSREDVKIKANDKKADAKATPSTTAKKSDGKQPECMPFDECPIKKRYTGVIADNHFFGTMLIQNQKDLEEKFIPTIVRSLHIVHSKSDVKSVPNSEDVFLNKKETIDFKKYDLLVYKGLNPESISVFGDQYIAKPNDEMVKDNSYYAVTVEPPANRSELMILDINAQNMVEQRPINDNMYVEQRPINDNMYVE
jgi:hypothetical protein